MRRLTLALASCCLLAAREAIAQETAQEHLTPKEKIGSVVSLDVYTHNEGLP